MTVNRIAFIALWIFVFSMPWERAVAIPGLGAAGTLFGLIAFAAGMVAVMQGGRLKARAPSLFLLLFGLFVFWYGISFFWTIDQVGARVRFETFTQFLVMSWLVWELCRTQARRLALLQAYVLGAYIVVIRIIYSFLANPFVPNDEQSLYRYTGIADNANSVATLVALGIAMTWYLAMTYRRGLRHWLFMIYIPLSVMALGLVASRSGMIVGVISLSLVPLTYGYLSATRRVVITILIVSISAVAISVLPEDNINRLSETTEEITDGNVSNRTQIWAAGLQAFRDSPIIGIGSGSYSEVVERVRGFGDPPHSAYFSTLVELGIIGLVLFLLALTVPILPLFQLPYKERAFYLVLWFAMVVAFMPGDFHTYKVPWFLLTLITTSRTFIVLPNSVGVFKRRKPQPQLEV